MGTRKILSGLFVLLIAPGMVFAGDYTANNDGTVSDNVTLLMWQVDDSLARGWEDAITYCEESISADYSDWRLPNIKELESILDDSLDSPAVDSTIFPNITASNYWSSTSNAADASGAWVVNFMHGNILVIGKTNDSLVQCVRYAD